MLLVLCVAFSMILPSLAWAAGPISNTLMLTVTVEEEEELTPPSILIHNDLAKTSAVGLYDYFTVEMVPGDDVYDDEIVKVKFVISRDGGGSIEDPIASCLELAYLELDPDKSGYNEYLPLSIDENGVGWFGPDTGFPVKESIMENEFRVTWKKAGTYNCTMSIMTGDNFNQQLGENESVTVDVKEENAMVLAHAWADAREVTSIDDPAELAEVVKELNPGYASLKIQVTKDGEFDYVVAADLDNEVSHVDNILFIFEVTKDDIAVGDFEITAISLRSDTEGINDTFELAGDNKLKGYWGPKEGFKFDGPAATAFTIKFNQTGSYSVQVYAIQVDK
ncbi:MAG TPA: hypothetical protein GXZ53_09505 [Firmicutes bacterium]|nr:hypothetical protein [Bacillota bacterium]